MKAINHYYRETNKCAMHFTKMGVGQSQDFVIFEGPASDVALLLYLDNLGVF